MDDDKSLSYHGIQDRDRQLKENARLLGVRTDLCRGEPVGHYFQRYSGVWVCANCGDTP